MCTLNKRLSKQLWGWWFETPSRPLWRHCNVFLQCVTTVDYIHQHRARQQWLRSTSPANMIPLLKLVIVSLALGLLTKQSQGYQIGLVCALSGSHVMMMGHLAEKLISKGHGVTLVLPTILKVPPVIRDMKIETMQFELKESVLKGGIEMKKAFDDMAANPSQLKQLLHLGMLTSPVLTGIGHSLLEDTELMNKLAQKKFDYMVIDPVVLSFLLVPYKLGVPFAIYHSDCFDHIRRIPALPSVVPYALTAYNGHMSFFQRVGNTIFNVITTLTLSIVTDFSSEHIPELPAVSIVDMIQNASLCLLLRDSSINVVRPDMPDVIPVATLMGRPAKPLTGDLKTFMDSSPNGVVLMSFGSVIDELPAPALKNFFIAFEQIDQRVIFKYKHKLDNVPANVHVVDWMPQNDLLGHPNMKLFVTHGGMNSYIEAVYQGVPVLAMPIAIDQYGTAALIKSQGIGDTLPLSDFTSEQLKNAITTIIGDTHYKNTATKLSAIYREIQASGLRDPVFWIEHVIKYGASHLRSHAYDMPFYQYAMFDVSVFLVACGLLLVTAMFLFCRCIATSLCGKPKGKKKKDWFSYHFMPLLWQVVMKQWFGYC